MFFFCKQDKQPAKVKLTKREFSQGDINRAEALVSVDILRETYRINREISALEEKQPYDYKQAAPLYIKMANLWLYASKQLTEIDSEASLVLLQERVFSQYSFASSHFFKYLHPAYQLYEIFEIEYFEKFLKATAVFCALANRLGFINSIPTPMGEIKQANDIAIKAVGERAVGMAFLKISKEIAAINHPDSLVQVFYDYAAAGLSAEFYNSKHPDNALIANYREAVDESWNRVVNLKDAVDRNEENQEDFNYCLALEKKVGDEIEKMSARLLQLHSLGYVLSGISYIPDERSKNTRHPTLKKRHI